MNNDVPQLDAVCDLSQSERLILAHVLSEGTIARSGLPSLTGMTQQAVHKLCDSLIQRRYLELGKAKITGRGKPSPRLSIDPSGYASAGISISTDSIRYCLLDLSGHPLIEETEENTASDPTGVAMRFAARLEGWKHNVVPGRTIVGLGVGMQGFRAGKADVFLPPPPLSAWENMPLRTVFKEHCSLPIFTDNNASASAIAETYLGDTTRHRCSVFLSFNYGFGAGISWQGKPFEGGHGNAGEISALFSRDDLPDRPALGELIKTLNANGVPVDSIRDLASGFDPNWPGVSDWLERIAPTIQSAVRALQATIDPEVIFFGGEAPVALRQLLIEISQNAFHDPKLPAPKLLPSKLNGDPAHWGGALLPLQKLIF